MRPKRFFKRTLDQHFRRLASRERAIVAHEQSRGQAFLLYDSKMGGVRSLCALRLDGSHPVHVGRGPENELELGWDQRVSNPHAKLEFEAGAWFIEDLQSKNGTFVAGERIVERRRLTDGDLISLSLGKGAPQLEFNAAEGVSETVAADDLKLPSLTPAQQRLLAAVCVHRLCGTGDEPATNDEVAKVLTMEPQSARKSLTALYEKFSLHGFPQGKKRRALVDKAVTRGLAKREHLPLDCSEVRKLLRRA